MDANEAQRLQALFRPADAPPAAEARPLPPLARTPSGRLLRALDGARGETLEIRDPEGRLELRVRLTEDGPVVEIDAVRLDLKATRTIAMDCDRFAVRARRSVDLRSDDVVNVRGEGNVNLDGDNVLLNCGSRPKGA
ncbi:MAG: hypothetical protein K0V04_43950 [Deltaproteobacteria bacterium]|nr:hypothetical protein [Deltaproteobacteria bacterium]